MLSKAKKDDAPIPTPKKKNILNRSPSLSKDAVVFSIDVTPASNEYLKKLKDEVDSHEKQNYSIQSFHADIAKDDFIKKAIKAHEAALRYKVIAYTKLAKYNWMDNNASKEGIQVNLNLVIKDMLEKIKQSLKSYLTIPLNTRIVMKRKQLESILSNEDNGISTIKGKSRENVRIMLIKIIYMFLQVPEFFFKGFVNFMVTGPAGSGKTKVAGVIAHIFSTLGILATDNVIMTTKQNFVGQFVGQSGPKTRKVLANSLEGVVFIDEAYTLTPCPSELSGTNEAFSREAVGELINFMDKFSGCFVIIVAGYKDKMYECFLTFNEGIARRFPKVLDFIPYQNEDMFEIFLNFVKDSIDIKGIQKEHLTFMKGVISGLNEKNVFSNQAGDMLNLAKMIAEDSMLAGEKYNTQNIVLTFKKFCATKNMAIQVHI